MLVLMLLQQISSQFLSGIIRYWYVFPYNNEILSNLVEVGMHTMPAQTNFQLFNLIFSHVFDLLLPKLIQLYHVLNIFCSKRPHNTLCNMFTLIRESQTADSTGFLVTTTGPMCLGRPRRVSYLPCVSVQSGTILVHFLPTANKLHTEKSQSAERPLKK